MKKERRKGLPPIPEDIRSILSREQKNALKELETFGWVIDYVRRPLFQQPRVIIRNPANGKRSIIEADGTVDHYPIDLSTRDSDG